MHVGVRRITPNLSTVFSSEATLRSFRFFVIENTEDGLRRPLVLQDDGAAQERMVLSVPPEKWEAFNALCAAESVEATILGEFVPTGRLQLKYDDTIVADLDMEFRHDGRPPLEARETAHCSSQLGVGRPFSFRNAGLKSFDW